MAESVEAQVCIAWGQFLGGGWRRPLRGGLAFRAAWREAWLVDPVAAVMTVRRLGAVPCLFAGIGFPWVMGVAYPIGLFALGIKAFSPDLGSHFGGFGLAVIGGVPIIVSGQRLFWWAFHERNGWRTWTWKK